MSHLPLRASLSLLLVLACAAGGEAADHGPGLPVAQPDANAGRSGTYHVDIVGHTGYGYYVCVPATYGAAHPAGVHLFFHGQGGQNGASSFDAWQGPFLERYNLIGINMQFMDGDNMKDPAGKAMAARVALAQVEADYKILVGRGVIASFSGGGVPASIITAQSDHARGPGWPFCESVLYSSNFRVDASHACPMAWSISVGEDEWGLATLGVDATHRTCELFSDILRGACPDVRFTVLPHKGHSIAGPEIQHAADAFERADLAFAPFVYLEDFPQPALRPMLSCCVAQQPGAAAQRLTKLLAKATLPAGVHDAAVALQQVVQARLARLAACSQQLAQQDVLLAAYYLPLYQAQAKGAPEEKVIHQAWIDATHAKAFEPANEAYAAFLKLFPHMLPGGGTSPITAPAQAANLRQCATALDKGEGAEMASGFVALLH